MATSFTEDTGAHIRIDELRSRQNELRADVEKHDGRIETLQRDFAGFAAEVRTKLYIVSWVGTTVGGGVIAALLAVLVKLYGGR